ncbi:hypothetical protein D6D29_10321 [Aureobasidium pullulans]|nr:hypothetical protein D6D29_10321 [Aureobasidium pullulans]
MAQERIMGKLLLTSGQVQVILSSAFVAGITFFLFLAGYTIQQHSIANLQSQLKPRIPIAPLSDSAQQPLPGPQHPSRLFNAEQNAIIADHIDSQQEAPVVNWQNLAHVQLVTNHHDVCNAILLFGDLARLKSPARRILLFPQAWAMEKQAAKHDMIDPYMDSTRRLLRRAARRYNVELRPISSSAGQEGDAFSIASLWGLTDLERVMLLQTPGLINDAEVLDGVLAYTESAPMTLLQEITSSNLEASDLILATPARETHRLLTLSSSNISTISSLLHPSYLPPTSLLTSIGSLHSAIHPNKTSFLDTPYILFRDSKLPGPEWEVEYKRVVEARPRDKDADWLWTKMYGEFAGRRYETCGLGLEMWREE